MELGGERKRAESIFAVVVDVFDRWSSSTDAFAISKPRCDASKTSDAPSST